MQDKVGSKIPSQKEIDDIIAALQAIEAKIEKFTIRLSKEERSSTTKMRTGGETVVPTIAGLVDEHGLTLPKISTDGMKADLLLAQRIRPLAEQVSALAQRLDDTVLEAQSECWWAATAFYTALARMSDVDAKLEAGLRPIIDFFALGRRKKAEASSGPK